MWIFLGIVGFLALLITVILLLPVYVVIKSDEEEGIILRYKFLGKTYGENPDPNNPIIKTLKKAAGLSRLEKKEMKKSTKKKGYFDTVRESLALILDLLKKILDLLKLCKVKKFYINIVSAEEDAAQAAINYGRYCAVASPVIAFIDANLKIGKRGRDINISCDYDKKEAAFDFDILLMVHLSRVLSALVKVIWEEAKRDSERRLEADRRKRAAMQRKSQESSSKPRS